MDKIITKIIGIYPVTRVYEYELEESIYMTLLMSTGLTFGSISALFGLSHQIIGRQQCSVLVFVVIGSTLVPTPVANAFFISRHLLPKEETGIASAQVISLEIVL